MTVQPVGTPKSNRTLFIIIGVIVACIVLSICAICVGLVLSGSLISSFGSFSY